jgi:hypothetical protein
LLHLQLLQPVRVWLRAWQAFYELGISTSSILIIITITIITTTTIIIITTAT